LSKYLLIISISIFLIGCGGSHKRVVEEENNNSSDIYEISMELYKPYIVRVGDKVIKKTVNAQIKITHIENEINSTVELIEGDADLIYLTPHKMDNSDVNSS